MRKDPLANGEFYHIVTRSIAGFRIFNNDLEFDRFFTGLRYYQYFPQPIKFFRYQNLSPKKQKEIQDELFDEKDKLVQIIAYCLMPTHIHLLLRQLKDDGISILLKNLLISYTRYFNLRHKRKGPLWESRFKNVLVTTDEQLLHLTRYIHLNPVSAGLVDGPKDWNYSSYGEYVYAGAEKICDFSDYIDLSPQEYRKFVKDRITYQKELSKIKKYLLERAYFG